MEKCFFCESEISETSLKCNYCGEWKKGKRISLKNPNVSSALCILCVYFLGYGLFHYFVRDRLVDLYSSKEIYLSEEPQNISIDHKTFRKQDIFVVGSIINNSKYEYSLSEIAVTFYDKNNQLVDVEIDPLFSLEPFEKRDFKIKFCKDKIIDINQYHHYKINVQGANRREKKK